MQAQAQPQFDTKPLLRPNQIESTQREIKVMERQLADKAIEEKGIIANRLVRIKRLLEEQAPRAPQNADEESRMVHRSEQLKQEMTQGMPSQEEMRKAPPGAVDKHIAWEQRNKTKILEWKNLQLRLKPGEREAANLERHRPRESSLNMDNAFIQGKQFYFPVEGVSPAVTFNDTELEFLRQNDPALASVIGMLNNEQRREAKNRLIEMGFFNTGAEKTPKKRGRPKKILPQ